MNAPELKPSTDWLSEWLGYNVGPEQKQLLGWIDDIQANAMAVARHQALTEAAAIVGKQYDAAYSIQEPGQLSPYNRGIWCCETALIALRDTKEPLTK